MSTQVAPTPAPNQTLTQGQNFTDPAGRTGVVGFDTSTGKPLASGGTTNSNPSLIVTSSASRSNHADNVNTINNANNNIRSVQAGQTASGIAASLGMTPENFLKLNPNFGATGNKGDYKGLSGMIQPGQTYKVGLDGTPSPVADEPKPDANGNTNTTDPNDGTTKTTDSDGNTTYTTPNGDVLDPSLKKMFDDNIA